MIQDIGPPRKEGLTSCRRAPFCVLRSLVGSLFLSPFFLSALRIPDGGVPRVLFARHIVEKNTRFLSFGESTVRFVAIKVSLQSDASTAFLERTSVSYIQHRETFLHLCHGITLLSPELNSLPRVENSISV